MANGQGSYKVGFKKVLVGVYGKDGQTVEKQFEWKDENGGTVNLNITGLAPELVDMFASNKRVWMKKQGTNEVKSDMDIFNIPSDDLNAVLGREKDQNGTAWVGENTRAPYVAMIGVSEDGLTGEPVYVALLKGTFSLDSIEFKTKGEKAEAPEPTKLTGDWMNRTIEVDGENQGIVYGYHEGKDGEDEFFKKVFVGYTDSLKNSDEEGTGTPS
ncbi:major tail protein [Staphylococcus carnosus]|uniref:Major tail protein n=1 Tax=Staphylococcus carnosus (strain TM300) TaxID=396513 RepID=B9DJ00_STACT|nr:major tail protein [Staphylococcus carnosus]QPT03594.1 phage tail protein [Staphylococcus carnosus]UQA66317.1 phage tail protein [Staphylococcus carnosus]UTB78844.1 phage tail protein [Staphylococcus carnosus]UTB88397.1 phage tail protein [Staphylococcus carnosus]UTB90745.1 phage tail protein [Staphylococcus carnosus]